MDIIFIDVIVADVIVLGTITAIDVIDATAIITLEIIIDIIMETQEMNIGNFIKHFNQTSYL